LFLNTKTPCLSPHRRCNRDNILGKCHGPCLPEEIIKKCEDEDLQTCHDFCPNPTTNSTEPPYTWEQKMTSGLEVTWTRSPTAWDNAFFRNM
jgi:catalase (peroxidase I)